MAKSKYTPPQLETKIIEVAPPKFTLELELKEVQALRVLVGVTASFEMQKIYDELRRMLVEHHGSDAEANKKRFTLEEPEVCYNTVRNVQELSYVQVKPVK